MTYHSKIIVVIVLCLLFIKPAKAQVATSTVATSTPETATSTQSVIPICTDNSSMGSNVMWLFRYEPQNDLIKAIADFENNYKCSPAALTW